MEEGKRSLAVDDVIGNKANMMATAPVNWKRRNRYRSTFLRKNAYLDSNAYVKTIKWYFDYNTCQSKVGSIDQKVEYHRRTTTVCVCYL
jgi:hypothetical protein